MSTQADARGPNLADRGDERIRCCAASAIGDGCLEQLHAAVGGDDVGQQGTNLAVVLVEHNTLQSQVQGVILKRDSHQK